MKKHTFVSYLFSFLLLQSCATNPSFVGAENTAKFWDEVFECVRTAPPGKSCGGQFKDRVYTARISTIQKDKNGNAQVYSRFGNITKALRCDMSEEKAQQFAVGDVIQFEGTVTGITSMPIQKSIEFEKCNLHKTETL